MRNSRVLAVDPSLRNWGMAFFVDDDLVDLQLMVTSRNEGKKSHSDLYAARDLYRGFADACRKFKPDYIISEIPHGAQSARGAIAMGIAIGIIATYPEGVNFVPVTPQAVKIALTGNKKATKSDMIAAAHERYPDAPWRKHKQKGRMVLTQCSNEHMADAVGVYLAGLDDG